MAREMLYLKRGEKALLILPVSLMAGVVAFSSFELARTRSEVIVELQLQN